MEQEKNISIVLDEEIKKLSASKNLIDNLKGNFDHSSWVQLSSLINLENIPLLGNLFFFMGRKI